MKLVEAIATPWSPYTVVFSRDGTRLAIGGGYACGNGGIVIRRLQDGAHEYVRWAEVLPEVAGLIEVLTQKGKADHQSLIAASHLVPTVSGLYFSDDDRFLAASMWDSDFRGAPTRLFEVDQLNVRLCHTIRARRQTRGWTPTGVLMHGDRIVTKFHRAGDVHSDSLSCYRIPRTYTIRATGMADYLTHSRMIIRDRCAVTGLKGINYSRPYCDYRGNPPSYAGYPTTEEVTVAGGLSARSLDDPSDGLFTPVRETVEVTAIANLPGDRGFVTGGREGEVDRWIDFGSWPIERLRQRSQRFEVCRRGAIAEHVPSTIMGLVSTATDHRLIAVNAGGELIIDVGTPDERAWTIPLPGSPRSIAAHPQQPLLAVGIKQGGCQRPGSVVALIELA